MSELDLTPVTFCACANLRKAARAVTQFYDEALQPTGLRATQLTVLVTIAIMKEATIQELANAMVMDRTTLTRNLRPVEKLGLVESVAGSDRRTRLVKLTEQGEIVLAEALPLWEKAQAKMTVGLGQETLDNLLGLLSRSIATAVGSSNPPKRGVD